MNAEVFPVEKLKGMVILHAVRLRAGLVLCCEIAPCFFSALPVINANIDRLPIKLLPTGGAAERSLNLERNLVDPGRAGYFPRTFDPLGVVCRNLRQTLWGTNKTVYGEKAQEMQHED